MPDSKQRFVSLWGPVLGWMGLIFWFSSIPSLRSPFDWDYFYRKCAHALEFGILCWLLCRAFGRGDWKPLAVAVLYAMSDEWHQAYVPGRRCSAVDVLIDSAGAAAGAWVFRRKRSG